MTWKKVCLGYWGKEETDVVCRTLRLPDGSFEAAEFSFDGLIDYVDDVECMGNETDIADCRYQNFGDHAVFACGVFVRVSCYQMGRCMIVLQPDSLDLDCNHCLKSLISFTSRYS